MIAVRIEYIIIFSKAFATSIIVMIDFFTSPVMAFNTKMIVTGDMTQIDLPYSQKSGLKDALEVLKDVKGIAKVEFDVKDIVRHKLVQRIVEAYEKKEKKPALAPKVEKE